ncbi:MAG: septum formation initiator family protein [Firmicutes bacterium]|nr:septum formation initiator family protein [Bacillota bacterium]
MAVADKRRLKRLHNARPRRRLRLALFVPFWIFLVAGFGGVILTQAEKRGRYVSETAQARQELDRLTQLSNDLSGEVRFNTGDRAVEKAARDRLGLVYPDEIIFETD